MDLKPSNVVIDNQGNDVLIDISGIGGVTHKWLAPEIQEILDPLSLPFEVRQSNDIWAYSQLLSAMAELNSNSRVKQRMKAVAAPAATKSPGLRLGLSCGMVNLLIVAKLSPTAKALAK